MEEKKKKNRREDQNEIKGKNTVDDGMKRRKWKRRWNLYEIEKGLGLWLSVSRRENGRRRGGEEEREGEYSFTCTHQFGEIQLDGTRNLFVRRRLSKEREMKRE